MKILPSKHIPFEETIMGVGKTVYDSVPELAGIDLDDLWASVRRRPNVGSRCRFAAALDFLFMTKKIVFDSGKISRRLAC